MAIIKKPTIVQPAAAPASDAIDKFIQGAPDAGAGKQEEATGKEPPSKQITIRLYHEQLARIKAAAKRQGITSAAYMKRAIAIQLESDNSK
jgi:predicted DNA binding CopG/RHH family protein